jgi:hypothetical protein
MPGFIVTKAPGTMNLPKPATMKCFSKRLGARLSGWLAGGAVLAGATGAPALVITPSWDSSITSDPNAATIESTINTAIQFYEARFSDNITVTIEFEEMSISGLEGHSQWWYYTLSYPQFRAALAKSASSTNDDTALAYLPSGENNPVTGSGSIRVKTATLRALGFPGYTSGLPGGFDGIIGLHVSQMNLSRATDDSDKYDLLSTADHEMDEVLGLGSGLDESSTDPFPEDLFRYTALGSRTYTTNGDDAYFSIDSANFPARFNQNTNGDRGDWWTAGAHTPQVQDAFLTPGAAPNPVIELVALDVIGYHLLPLPQPVITSTVLSGTQLVLTGTNGLASETYYVLTSTNLALPFSQWTRVATSMLNANGDFTMTLPNAVDSAGSQQFYILQAK